MAAHVQARDHALIAAAAYEDLLAKRRAIGEDETEEESEEEEEEEEDMDEDNVVAGATRISDEAKEDEEDMEDEDELAGAHCFLTCYSS